MEPPPLNNHFIIPLPDLEADSNTPQLPLVEVTDVWQTPVESLLFHSFGDTQPKAVGTITPASESDIYLIKEGCYIGVLDRQTSIQF